LTICILSNNDFASDKTQEHLKEHINYWLTNKLMFITLVKKIRSIEHDEIQTITLMTNDDHGNELSLFPANPINSEFKTELKKMMSTIGISKIRIYPSRLAFLGNSTFIGNDPYTSISLSSAYIYFFNEVYNLKKNDFCSSQNLPAEASYSCFVQLEKNWLMQFSLFYPEK